MTAVFFRASFMSQIKQYGDGFVQLDRSTELGILTYPHDLAFAASYIVGLELYDSIGHGNAQ